MSNQSQYIVQNTSGSSFAVNSNNRISRIFFQNQLLNAIEVICHDETAFVVDGSLLSLNEPNNILGVTTIGRLFVVNFIEGTGFISNTFKPNGWNDYYKVIPKTLHYSISEKVIYGVLNDASIIDSLSENQINEKLGSIVRSSKLLGNKKFQISLNNDEFHQMGKYFLNNLNSSLLTLSLKKKIINFLYFSGFDLSLYFDLSNKIFYLFWDNIIKDWKMGLINRSTNFSVVPKTFSININDKTLQYIDVNGDMNSSWEGNQENNPTQIKSGVKKLFSTFNDSLFNNIDNSSRVLKT